MKRLWVVGILLVLLVSFCSFGIYQIAKHEEKIIGILTEAMEAAEQEDFERAYELSMEGEREWIKSEKALSLFTNHLDLSNVGLAIAKLPPLIKHGDKSQFLAECAYTIVRVKHLANEEMPSLSNLF